MPPLRIWGDRAAVAESRVSFTPAAAAAVEGGPTLTVKRHYLGELCAPLEALPEATRPYAARKLLECVGRQRALLTALGDGSLVALGALGEQTAAVLQFVGAYGEGLAAFPAVTSFDMLELEAVSSQLLMPFVAPSTGGSAEFGIPTVRARSRAAGRSPPRRCCGAACRRGRQAPPLAQLCAAAAQQPSCASRTMR